MPDLPFRAHTQALLDAVNTLNLDALRAMVDDDYGIVDVDPQGRTVVIDTKAQWDAYMVENIAAMRAADAVLYRVASERSACRTSGKTKPPRDLVGGGSLW